MPVTITLQAASDSVMTVDNLNGTLLADDDLRKVYGLPNMYVANANTMSAVYGLKENDERVYLVQDGSRWDTVKIPETNESLISNIIVDAAGLAIASVLPYTTADDTASAYVRTSAIHYLEVGMTVVIAGTNSTPNINGTHTVDELVGIRGFVVGPYTITSRGTSGTATRSIQAITGNSLRTESTKNSTAVGAVSNTARFMHQPPTTTAFELRCESIEHIAEDMAGVSPLPAWDLSSNVKAASGTPGQLNTLVVALGMRTEIIRMTGVLVDEGIISPSNPRKQVLLNIARMQYLKTGRGGSINRWGGENSSPLNPRSYPCLTIFDSSLSTGDFSQQVGLQPSNHNLSYRGLIKSFSFRTEGGRPNQWFWTLEFQVLNNEHSTSWLYGLGKQDGMLHVNRIRLVDLAGEQIDNNDYPTAAFVELRMTEDIGFPVGYETILDAQGVEQKLVKERRLQNFQRIKITDSNSIPSVNGSYRIHDVDVATRTLRIANDGAEYTSGSNTNRTTKDDEPNLGVTWTRNSNPAVATDWVDGSNAFIVSVATDGDSNTAPVRQFKMRTGLTPDAIEAMTKIEDEKAEMYKDPDMTDYGADLVVTTSISTIAVSSFGRSVITTSANHGLFTNWDVEISGSNSTPSVNGTHVVTVISDTTFSIEITVTTAGSAGTVVNRYSGLPFLGDPGEREDR